MPTPDQLWRFLLIGYVLTVAVEVPVLLCGLSARHSMWQRLQAGLWLTACTYPIVVLVLPFAVWLPFNRTVYLMVAEIMAPLTECLLFYLAFDRPNDSSRVEIMRNSVVVAGANLVSFLVGEWYGMVGWL